MDPVNERKVFELVVQTVCRKSNTQYFLLTPKVRPNAGRHQAWELSTKMQISSAVKLTFHREKKCPWGKEIGGTKKKRKKGSAGFSSAPNTRET